MLSSTLAHALDLWRRGLSVFPVPAPRPGAVAGTPGDGKVPDAPWGQYQHERATEDQVRHWFGEHQRHNIAVACGSVSGVVVLDADSPEAVRWVVENLTRTPWQTKTPRGFHFWYRCPTVRVGNKARVETRAGRLALDLRGDGGYVIAPGSVHASGARYSRAGDWTVPRDQLPRFWVGWLARPAWTPRPTVGKSAGPSGNRTIPTDLVERARRYLTAIPVPEIGHGSDEATLYAAARLTRGFGLSESDATALLWAWAGGRDGWSPEWVATKVHNAHVYGNEPLGAMR